MEFFQQDTRANSLVRTYAGQTFSFDEIALLSDKGGMAIVYLGARRDDPSIQVALKTPRTAGLPTEVASLFLREAKAAARVAGDRVVPIVDWGDSPPFIAYEFMSGGTLADQITARAGGADAWSEAELLDFYLQLADGMKSINAEVIHRDLKPDNIFIDASGPRIGDFGIAKYAGEITRSETFKGWGTAAYMAPETFNLDSADPRSDQYSLGVIFFEMATLVRPFVGDWAALKQAHLYDAAPRITTLRSDLPPRLGSLIARMIEKRLEERFPTWDALIEELMVIRQGSAVESVSSDAANAISPLVAQAAAALDEAKARQLASAREADEGRRLEHERDKLLDYWADHFFDYITRCVEGLNAQLGQEAYKVDIHRAQGTPPKGSHQIKVTFFRGTLTLTLSPAPIGNQSRAVAWGTFELRTWGRSSFSNLILIEEPAPYGEWLEVVLQMSGILRPGAQPEHVDGGTFEIIGRNRIVLATSWAFLAAQREVFRNSMSTVNYTESSLGFENLIAEQLRILTEDGPNEQPQEPPQERRRPYRFPDV